MRLAALVAALHRAFDAAAAMADVAQLCRHDRYQASAGIEAAAGYVAERAVGAGLADVEILRFPADGTRRWWTFAAPLPWTPLRASLLVDGVAVVRYPEQPYALAANSTATSPGGRECPLVHWPHGASVPALAGAVVVLDGGWLPAALPQLLAGGAAGVVTDPLATSRASPSMIARSVSTGSGTRTRADTSGDHESAPRRPGGRLAVDLSGSGTPAWAGQVGRLELPPGCPLFAFSVTAEQLATLRQAARRRGGATARVLVELDDRAATLPVVTGRLPTGADGGEVLLSAHLCHPRPSANDNASGVAALLGIARATAQFVQLDWPARSARSARLDPPARSAQLDQPARSARLGQSVRSTQPVAGGGAALRFLWGPEFVGMAAYLHDVVHAGRAARPVAAVNVDMAGEDQRRCGGPLVIERGPDELPSPLSAVALRCAALIPPAARSYSGAVACETWSWRATPYAGASDHAMLAGPPTGCPAISLGHWPDTANHTSADTIDLVDPAELRRTATIAGATATALARLGAGYAADDVGAAGDAELAADVADATVAWAASHVLSTLPGARPPAPPRPDAGPVVDPWAPEHSGLLLAHRGSVAVQAVRSLRGTAVPAAAIDRAERWIDDLTTRTAALVPAPAACGAPGSPGRAGPGNWRDLDEVPALWPAWSGPFNLRHLTERAPSQDARWLAEVCALDRGGSYARLLALARGLDGRRDGLAVAWWAALTSELAIPVAMAHRFLDLLCRAGFAQPAHRAPIPIPTAEA
jgi:hypothetical protein